MQRFDQTVYLDCFSGISGDMLLAALLHCGLDEKLLATELAKLGLADLDLQVEESRCQSISCRKVRISAKRNQELRTLPAIRRILENSNLSQQVCQKADSVFHALAEAEAKVHGIDISKVHFHEIGAIDTIADVVGTIIGLEQLGISRIVCSPLPLGRGFIDCDHGRLPLPAPAVCELLEGIPTYGVEIEKELVTPTGAALVKALADDFGPLPPMSITATGYGAGSHILPNNQPNLLRLMVGTPEHVTEAQTVVVTETRLDDWSPESFPHLVEILLARGALDVNLVHAQGKKGRPGFTLQVISRPTETRILQDTLLSETTAIGLRFRTENRRTLPRETVTIQTSWGELSAKKVQTPRGPVLYPEYEACREIAVQNNISIDEIYRAVYASEDSES